MRAAAAFALLALRVVAAVSTLPRSALQSPAAVGYVPHFAGKPCAETGTCPWGPNCTVCGSYCGPGWCGNSCVNEGAECDFSVPPQQLSCTDSCCRMHDMCCGCVDADSPDCDKSGCNKVLAACLSSCPWYDKCSGPDGTWGPKLIELVFQLEKGRCCGSKCPGDPPDAPAPGPVPNVTSGDGAETGVAAGTLLLAPGGGEVAAAAF